MNLSSGTVALADRFHLVSNTKRRNMIHRELTYCAAGVIAWMSDVVLVVGSGVHCTETLATPFSCSCRTGSKRPSRLRQSTTGKTFNRRKRDRPRLSYPFHVSSFSDSPSIAQAYISKSLFYTQLAFLVSVWSAENHGDMEGAYRAGESIMQSWGYFEDDTGTRSESLHFRF